MRTCPNRHCRLIHEDGVNQCPECGAPMGRKPDAEQDPNMALYASSARAHAERGLERRLASRRNSGGGREIDTGAPVQVMDAASEIAGEILGLYNPHA